MKPDDESVTPPAAPSGAAVVFGDRLHRAEAFVALLADTGVTHGLIGPREVPRLWDRHLMNCAVIADAFPEGATVVDVGSGAGLPGIALALARPDLRVRLVEPMARRTSWLEDAVDRLELRDAVSVHRGRAEELTGEVASGWVTARAVARLDKLARWCLPLLLPGGTLVAMKGRSAADELAECRPTLRRLGVESAVVTEHGREVLPEAVLTVDCRIGEDGRASTGARGTSRTGKPGVGGGRGRPHARGNRSAGGPSARP